jgi:hypothetical protein
LASDGHDDAGHGERVVQREIGLRKGKADMDENGEGQTAGQVGLFAADGTQRPGCMGRRLWAPWSV